MCAPPRMQILWHELGNFRAISADVRIQPNLCGFTWTDYHRPREIIALGAAAAEHALPAIRRALAAKLSAPAAREWSRAEAVGATLT